MKKKLMVSAFLSMMMVFSSMAPIPGYTGPIISTAASAAFTMDCTPQAETLKALGLFSGTSKGFELTRNATRAEAATMLVRLLGKETEAKNGTYSHPFTDVPGWANANVGYLYASGLTKGVDATHFGSERLAAPNQYASFILRALGYDDASGDFLWSAAILKGVEIGLFTSAEGTLLSGLGTLPRGALVLASYNGLYANRKGTTESLLKMLYSQSKCISATQIANASQRDTRLANFVKASLPEAVVVPAQTISFASVDTLVINTFPFKKTDYAGKVSGSETFLFIPLEKFKYAFKYPYSGDFNFPEVQESGSSITLTWRDDLQAAFLEVGLWVGSSMVTVNGQTFDAVFGPYLLNNQVMVPINLFAAALQMKTEVFSGRTYLQYSDNFPPILLEGTWSDVNTSLFTEFADYATGSITLPTYASSYSFNADGTYHRGIISTGGFSDMLLLQDGKYKVIGNTIIYYNIVETVYKGTPFVLQYKNKSKPEPEFEFIDNYNSAEEKIEIEGFWLHRPK